MAMTIPYNVRKLDNGQYMPYLPSHPYIGCPCIGSRDQAMAYIAQQIGMTLADLREALKKGSVKLEQAGGLNR